MKEIINILKEKYNVDDINHVYIKINIQLLEFKLNAFNSVKIYKIDDNYNLIISIINSNSFPTKNININLKYNSYEKLIIDLGCFYFS